jgi:hypothetical protein
MTAPAMQVLAGISVPSTPLIDKAIDYARECSEPYMFNHVVRSWLFAVRIGEMEGIEYDGEVVAIGTLLHDITLTKDFNGPRRFEVEGADIAREFVREAGFDDRRAQLIWDSVALNSTPSIGLYKEAEVALCTAGIGLDFAGRLYNKIPSDEMRAIVGAYPRLGMKKQIAECVCCIVANAPQTTYGTFASDFGARFVAAYQPISLVDLLMDTPFES